MNLSLLVPGAIGTLLVFTGTTCRAADDSVAQRIASAIVKTQAVEFLKDRKYEFKQSQFEVVAEAVDPEKQLKVSIREFKLLPHSVEMSTSMQSRFEIRGKLKTDDQTTDVAATADIDHLLSVAASFHELNNELVIEARVKDIEFKVDILKISPADFPGGKDGIKQLADSVLKNNRARFLKEINDWLARRRITNK